MIYRKWTNAEKNLIVRLRKQNASIKFICERLSATPNQIRGILNKCGVTKKRKWTAKDDARLFELVNQGMKSPQIADILGRTAASVNQRRYNLRKHKK